jgi:S-layer protein
VTAPGAVTATAAATTAITVTGSAQAANAIAVNGGSTVTVSSTDQTTGTITVGATSAAAGAVSVTASGDYTDGGNNTLGAIAVTGGTTVSVTSKTGFTTAETTAAKTDASNFTETLSNVTVTGNGSTADVTVKQDKSVVVAQAAAAVTESWTVDFNDSDGTVPALAAGDTVTIGGLTATVKAGQTATDAQVAAAFANLANGATGTDTTQLAFSGALTGWSTGAVGAGADLNKVTFTSSTAGVNVTNLTVSGTQTAHTYAALTKVDAAAAVEGVIGVTNGTVTINDVNAASATAAGVIKTVTLENYGNSTINSGALTTVNLSGNAGTLGVTAGALNTAAVNTLALNVNGVGKLTGGNNAVTLDADNTTLNLGGNTAASTIDNVTATGVKTLNISGDAKVTLTNNTFAALETVTVTNTAGAVLGTTALVVNVTYTGGDGADSVIMTTGHNKALNMGKGNDTVVYNGAVTATKGSVDAGEGEDTIVMTVTEADAVDGDSTFNTTFKNFEVLSIEAAGAGATIDLAGINGVKKVTNAGGATGVQTFNNMASGGTFTLTGAVGGGGSYVVGVTNAALATTDSLNIGLTNSTADVVAFGSVTAANVETINISTNDTGTRFSTAATIDTVTLVATAATKVVVSGNNGLNITNTGNVAITEFDASGVVANDALDTAANLGVTFVSAHGDATKAVTIKGGAGNDTLTGAANADTITGGEGADTITGGAGNDTIILTETTAARDVVVFNAVATNGVDTIKGFQAGNTTTSDKVMLVAAATTNAALATANVADFGASTNTTLTAGAAAFALTGANTATDDIIEINATLSSYGNLGLTGATSGAELLKALSSTDSAATSITANNADDDFYLVAYQNGNAYLYQVVNDANTAVIASEITLVGTFEGVAQGAFVAGDFLI